MNDVGRPFRLVTPLVVTVAVCLLAGWYVWRRPVLEQRPTVLSAPAAIGLGKAELVLRHKGEKQAEVLAERVEVSRDLQYATFKGIPRAILYDRGQASLRLRADEIVLNRQTNDLLVRGDIEISSPQGDQLRAPEARWVAARQRLVFQRGIWLKIAESEVRASRLVVDLGLQSLELEGRVDVTFRIKGGVP